MKPYPKTKPSGVQWLGDVPEHWEVKRSDNVVSAERVQISREAFAESDVFHYSIPVVQETGTGQVEEGSTIASAKQVVKKPVVLVSKLNPRKATICVAEPQELLTLCSTEFVALNADHCQLRFLDYLTRSELFRQKLNSKVQSVTRSHQRANPTDIYRFWSAWPQPQEQTAIAAYLDRVTGRIDELVGKKRDLIERLKEKRSALISRTVTRGLPADLPPAALAKLEALVGQKLPLNPPLKPSGVDWLGDVPEHWGVKRLKFTLTERLKYGANEAADNDDPELPRYVRITDIDDSGKLRPETFRSLPTETAKDYYLEDGDVLFARSGATTGKTFLYRSDWGTCAYAGYLIRARLDQRHLDPGFLRHYTDSVSYWQWLSSSLIQATIQNVSAEKYADLALPLPPLPDQRAIAAYLDEETAKLDSLVAKVETAIERLQEYRIALITAAVTGKIDVREEVMT